MPILRASADHSAFLLGMGAVWTATQPDLLGGELTDLWPMLQSDMNNFLGNMTMLDSECSGQRVEVLQSTWEAVCKVILRKVSSLWRAAAAESVDANGDEAEWL